MGPNMSSMVGIILLLTVTVGSKSPLTMCQIFLSDKASVCPSDEGTVVCLSVYVCVCGCVQCKISLSLCGCHEESTVVPSEEI